MAHIEPRPGVPSKACYTRPDLAARFPHNAILQIFNFLGQTLIGACVSFPTGARSGYFYTEILGERVF